MSGQSWLTIGAKLDASLGTLPTAQRSAVLSEASLQYGLEVRTLRNILKSYRYAKSYSSASGVPLEDVKAAAITIDVLMRVEKKSPIDAFDRRQQVFDGSISYRDMLRVERRVDDAKKNVLLLQEKRDYFAIDLFELLFRDKKGSWKFSNQRDRYSRIGQILSVDWELSLSDENSEKNESTCVFLSPFIAFSQFRGKSIEAQISSVIAAQHYYDRVVYFLSDKQEELLVKSIIGMSHRREIIIETALYDDLIAGDGQNS